MVKISRTSMHLPEPSLRRLVHFLHRSQVHEETDERKAIGSFHYIIQNNNE